MQGIQIEQFEEDTTLNGIGSLFRKLDGSAWGINVELSPRQDTRSLRFSMAPILVRKRAYNLKSKVEAKGWKDTFRNTNSEFWELCKISDCPAIESISKYDGKQFCFRYELYDGKQIYIPQFELARALFLRDGYIARMALEQGQLDMEFDVQFDEDENCARVNVMPFSKYPIRLFNEPDSRSILSWMLIDQGANSSFKSISRYQLLDGLDINNYRRWDFKFDPPPLSEAEFDIRGIFDPKTQSLFVFEITAIRNIKIDLPPIIEFYHPKFEEYIRGSGNGGHQPNGEPPDGHIIHDGLEANIDTEQVILRPPVVSFEFSGAFKTIKRPLKKRANPAGKKDEDTEPVSCGKDVSVEDVSTEGSLSSADFDTTENETDDSSLYANKFDCFKQMLDLLSNEYKCQISTELRKLKRHGRSRKHLLSTTGEARHLLVANIISGTRRFRALELDMSDDGKYISTMLIEYTDDEHWPLRVEYIESELVRLSLRWPTGTLKKFYGKGKYKGIPHPETKSDHKGKLDPISIEHWAERFFSWMNY